MLVHSNSFPKLGVFGVQHINKKIETMWRYSHVRDFLAVNEFTVQSTRYKKMYSQVLKEMRSDAVISDHLQPMPVSLSYEDAMEILSSLITRQNRRDRSPIGGKYGKLERMYAYLKILGLEERLSELKIIHIAGTKGKGSTCTFCEAILRECGFRTGLFTSPHLIDVRERFRINGLDISENKFLEYFWDCWKQLKEMVTEDLPMPPLFQFLTVLALKIFICEQVDVAIIEVGLGGTRDSTNVIKEPVVCGITSLGLDHMETLGSTLGQITSHKAGIFKPRIPAFTVPQLSEAMDVLQESSNELLVPLDVAVALDDKLLKGLKLGLAGDHQLINAGLAISLCKCWLQRTGNWEKIFQNDNHEADLPDAFRRGLSTASLSGRAQIVYDTCSESYGSSKVTGKSSGDLVFYLDGAHSPESIEASAKWFSGAVKGNNCLSSEAKHKVEVWGNGYIQNRKENIKDTSKISKQVLLFNCMELRDPQILLPQLVNTCASSGTHFSKALFIPSMSTYRKVTSGASIIPLDSTSRDLSWQFNLQKVWQTIINGRDVVPDKRYKMNSGEMLPPREFVFEDASCCGGKDFPSSAVIPSLPLAIKWLRNCVKENPSLRVQVLVTGSLHLVGDVLKILRR